jgi:hypothetical protein
MQVVLKDDPEVSPGKDTAETANSPLRLPRARDIFDLQESLSVLKGNGILLRRAACSSLELLRSEVLPSIRPASASADLRTLQLVAELLVKITACLVSPALTSSAVQLKACVESLEPCESRLSQEQRTSLAERCADLEVRLQEFIHALAIAQEHVEA